MTKNRGIAKARRGVKNEGVTRKKVLRILVRDKRYNTDAHEYLPRWIYILHNLRRRSEFAARFARHEGRRGTKTNVFPYFLIYAYFYVPRVQGDWEILLLLFQ
jgi:hypothetical protein